MKPFLGSVAVRAGHLTRRALARHHVAVEYDGVHHWTDRRQRAWDIDRLALLEAAGWAVIRVSSDMLKRPAVIVERVRAKLRAAGCPV